MKMQNLARFSKKSDNSDPQDCRGRELANIFSDPMARVAAHASVHYRVG
jgi:hypothetical protein